MFRIVIPMLLFLSLFLLFELELQKERITRESLKYSYLYKYEKAEELEKHNEVLLQELNYYKSLVEIKEYLRGYSVEEQALALALAWTESSWRYGANHQGLYSNICGNMPWFWDDYLEEKGVESNSLEACITIYNHYVNKGHSPLKAIVKYKGIKSEDKYFLASNTLKLKKLIKKKLKENNVN